MLYDLVILPEVDQEIEELSRVDEDAAAELDLLLERLQEDQPELESLCVPGLRYSYDPAFEVKKLAAAQKRGKNIFLVKYRLQDGALADYRLLIGFDAQNGTYYALQVANRNTAYEVGSESFHALLDRYEQCGIPTY